MRVLRISWRETARGWADRPDGFSFHKSVDDASAYLAGQYNSLPPTAPDEYSYPGVPWGETAYATPVTVSDKGPIAKGLEHNSSVYVGTSNGSNKRIEDLYQAAKTATCCGGGEAIDYMTKVSTPERPRNYKCNVKALGCN